MNANSNIIGKGILIVEKNAEAIEAALKAVNGRADKHAITTFSEIAALAERAEKHLDECGISRTNRVGTLRRRTSGGSVAKSYRYKRFATFVELRREKDGWRLIDAEQVELWPNEDGNYGRYIFKKKAWAQYQKLEAKKEKAQHLAWLKASGAASGDADGTLTFRDLRPGKPALTVPADKDLIVHATFCTDPAAWRAVGVSEEEFPLLQEHLRKLYNQTLVRRFGRVYKKNGGRRGDGCDVAPVVVLRDAPASKQSIGLSLGKLAEPTKISAQGVFSKIFLADVVKDAVWSCSAAIGSDVQRLQGQKRHCESSAYLIWTEENSARLALLETQYATLQRLRDAVGRRG